MPNIFPLLWLLLVLATPALANFTQADSAKAKAYCQGESFNSGIYKRVKTIKDSIEQILTYMDKVGSKEGWVVIFDRTPKKSWSKKLYMKEVKLAAGKKITIFGC